MGARRPRTAAQAAVRGGAAWRAARRAAGPVRRGRAGLSGAVGQAALAGARRGCARRHRRRQRVLRRAGAGRLDYRAVGAGAGPVGGRRTGWRTGAPRPGGSTCGWNARLPRWRLAPHGRWPRRRRRSRGWKPAPGWWPGPCPCCWWPSPRWPWAAPCPCCCARSVLPENLAPMAGGSTPPIRPGRLPARCWRRSSPCRCSACSAVPARRRG